MHTVFQSGDEESIGVKLSVILRVTVPVCSKERAAAARRGVRWLAVRMTTLPQNNSVAGSLAHSLGWQQRLGPYSTGQDEFDLRR